MSLFGDITGFISAGRAAGAVGNAYIAGEHGIENATTSATGGIESQLGKAYNDVGAAGANINAATGTANQGLQGLLSGVQGTLAPSIASGAQGNTALQAYAASNPQFNFNLQDYLNSPALKFQLQQGTEALTDQASASGLGASGNTAKALEQYGQGLASTYYNQAFNQAQTQFQTNQNTTLQNLQALINSGQAGNALNLSAINTLGAPQSQNLINAANTNAGLQQYLAGLGLQGQEAAGQESLKGADLAGQYAVGAGNARSSGILGQGVGLTNIVGDVGGLAQMLLAGGGS